MYVAVVESGEYFCIESGFKQVSWSKQARKTFGRFVIDTYNNCSHQFVHDTVFNSFIFVGFIVVWR